MIRQVEFTIGPMPRGFHLITSEVESKIGELPSIGLLNLMIKHTSCGLAISENYDPDVRHDLEVIMNEMVPEDNPQYWHTMEGSDDMPSHAKSILSGVSLNIPISNGRMNLGTWQGIYLCEYRNHAGPRKIVATIID